MGLFDKKFCGVCGQKVGTIFHKKLEDGFLCKDCCNQLSPFFSERRSSTVEEIREQIAYRQKNREVVADFHITKTLGRDMKVLIDEDKYQFMVTRARNIQEANPDVISISQITGVDFDFSHDQTEVKRKDAQGNMVSYIPPRYTYTASIGVKLHVNHPYFNEIDIPIDTSITLNPGNPLPQSLMPKPENCREFMEANKAAAEIQAFFNRAQMSMRTAQKKAATKTAIVCPLCGATTIPDANGCCEYCGGATGK